MIGHSLGRRHRGARPKARAVINEKFTLASGLLREIRIWKVDDRKKYSIRYRYRLVLVEPVRGVVWVLMDNHWPKGPHVHLGQHEESYEFRGVEALLRDFSRFCAETLRR